MADKKKKKTGLGVALWLLAMIIVFILVASKWDQIKKTMDETHFVERISGKEENVSSLSDDKKEVEQSDKNNSTPFEFVLSTKDEKIVSSEKIASVEEPKKEVKTEEKKVETKVETKTEKKVEQKTETKVEPKKELPSVKPVEKSIAKLYFVTSDGSKKYIERTIEKNDSPLTNNLNLLFEGPIASEKNNGVQTLIPQGTKLKSLKIENGIAKINLSQEFEFNAYANEGYKGSLMQIVYTATEFSTVNSVQILIEGQAKEYLGSEGYWIREPLSRSSF